MRNLGKFFLRYVYINHNYKYASIKGKPLKCVGCSISRVFKQNVFEHYKLANVFNR